MQEHVVVHLETSKAIWDTCAKLYYSTASLQRVYDVFQSMLATKQGDNIHEFLARFRDLLQEWKIAQPYSVDIVVQEKQREALAAAICLTNIKPYLEVAKAQLLSSSALPSFDDISATLLWIRDPSPPSPIDAPSTMFSGNWGMSSPFRGRGRNTRGGRNRGGRVGPTHPRTESQLCTYCGGQNHLVDSCWKRHGKPDWVTANPASVNVEKKEDKTDSHSENVIISSEDYVVIQKLKSLLDQSSTPPGSTVATTIASDITQPPEAPVVPSPVKFSDPPEFLVVIVTVA
ncbi:uncharacterized protein [Aristolochia californica]|uniref:uncharacterized protein n=1 Tax=Aristolochia californica TaxID=171875 RepID=UPI0035DEFE03